MKCQFNDWNVLTRVSGRDEMKKKRDKSNGGFSVVGGGGFSPLCFNVAFPGTHCHINCMGWGVLACTACE